MGKGEECGGGGPVETETMLSGRNWEVVIEFWKQEAFQDFDSGAEEGDSGVGEEGGEEGGVDSGVWKVSEEDDKEGDGGVGGG